MASTKMSFSDLPGEIRNKIYDQLTIFDKPIDIFKRNIQTTPTLYRTSKQIRQEGLSNLGSSSAVTTYWANNAFTVIVDDNNIPAVIGLLNNMQPDHLRSMSRLILTFDASNPTYQKPNSLLIIDFNLWRKLAKAISTSGIKQEAVGLQGFCLADQPSGDYGNLFVSMNQYHRLNWLERGLEEGYERQA